MPQVSLHQSSVGKKVLMAITGLILLGFVVGHLAGNLLIFLGPEALNAYAKKILNLGPLLWVIRFFLLSIFLAHIGLAVKLTLENKSARPIGYMCKQSIQTTYASRTMMISGMIVLLYVIYHLLHFTVKTVHVDLAQSVAASAQHDVFKMVVLSFQYFPISLVYILATALLAWHLSHGIKSLCQSLGWVPEGALPKLTWISRIVAGLIFVGYASIPAAVFLGVITLPAGGAG